MQKQFLIFLLSCGLVQLSYTLPTFVCLEEQQDSVALTVEGVSQEGEGREIINQPIAVSVIEGMSWAAVRASIEMKIPLGYEMVGIFRVPTNRGLRNRTRTNLESCLNGKRAKELFVTGRRFRTLCYYQKNKIGFSIGLNSLGR